MSLTGNLLTMPLPEILQWIATGRKSGTLHIGKGALQARLMFRGGSIQSSFSNDPRLSLGQFLVRERLIGEEQLFTALLRQEKEGRLLGAILVGDGLLDEEQLRRVLQLKAGETIYDLFLWPEGSFEFREGDLPPSVFYIEEQVQTVLLEGIRRVDEWERIRKVFPTMATTFRLKAQQPVEDAVEREALGLVAAGKSLAQISLEMHRSEFDTAALLFDMLARDLVQVASVEETAPPDPILAMQKQLELGARSLREKRFELALRAYEAVLTLDRLNQEAKKGLIAVVEAKSRERALRSVPLDKVPSLQMDFAELTRQSFDPQEGFVLSRVNGQWDVRSILKLCPMAEEDALLIFARLLERKVIALG